MIVVVDGDREALRVRRLEVSRRVRQLNNPSKEALLAASGLV